MKAQQLNALVTLAGGSKSDDLSKHMPMIGSNTRLAEALQRKMDKNAEEAIEEAAESIMEIIATCNNKIAKRVANVRSLRMQEKQEMREIKKLERACAYGNETNNWLPLAILSGTIGTYEVKDQTGKKVLQVPDDWKPAVAVEIKVGE